VQKAGHGELVTTPEGRTFLVHLGSRVARDGDERMSLFGRETFVQPVDFDREGWPRLHGGGTLPLVGPSVVPPREESAWGTRMPQWPWSTLRRPAAEAWADAASRPGWLVLRGGDGLESLFEQSLVARRVREAGLRFSVEVEAAPRGPDQLAGIHVFYDTETWAMLAVTADYAGMRELVLVERNLGSPERELARIPAPDRPLTLELRIADGIVRFSCGTTPVGGGIPFSRYSDDHGDGLRFTGPMVGVTAIDAEAGVWSAAFGPPKYVES
jgi:xylan 1,4-beta-xylosidase